MKIKTLFREYNYPDNTISGTAGSAVITGSGTKFTEQLVTGADLEVELTLGTNTYLGKVLSITDDDTLTLDRNVGSSFSGKLFWVDWSFFRLDSSKVKRNVESKAPAKSGVVCFDAVTLEYYFGVTVVLGGATYYNPVYKAFQVDLDIAKRFLMRRQALDISSNEYTTFEGMINFQSIQYPDVKDDGAELIGAIRFEVKDKLSALSILDNTTTQRGAVINMWTRVTGYPGALNVWVIEKVSSDTFYIATLIDNVQVEHSTPILSKGETFVMWNPDTSEFKNYLVIDSGVALGWDEITTWFKLYPDDIATLTNWTDLFESKALTCYSNAYYSEDDICIYTGGTGPVESFDLLKILPAIVQSRWADLVFVNNLIDGGGSAITEFPIPLHYYNQLIDELPFGVESLDAVIDSINGMLSYLFYDRLGQLTIQNKNRYAASGDKTIPIEYIESSIKNEYWDKLNDVVTVNCKSFVYDDENDEYLTGTGSYYKSAGITARNELTIEIIITAADLADAGITVNTDGSLSDTLLPTGTNQEILDRYASVIAESFFNFYGYRHQSYDITLNKIDADVLQWEMLDTFSHQSKRWFLTNFSFDEIDGTAEFTIVSITSTDYEIKNIILQKSSESSQKGGTSSSSIAVTAMPSFDNYVTPEQKGALGNGTTDDATALLNAIYSGANLRKIVMPSKAEYLAASNIQIDLQDSTDTGDLNVMAAVNNSTISPTEVLSNSIYYAFDCGTGGSAPGTYPSNDAYYTTNGTNRLKIINADTPRITEYVLAELTYGAAPGASGTLTKVSGTGNNTYTFTSKFNGQYYLPTGALQFKNGKSIKLSGITIDMSGVSRTFTRLVGEYLDGLLIENFDEVYLENIYVYGAPLSGIYIRNCQNVYIKNCRCEYNLFAGLRVSSSKHVVINGGVYSYNGNHGPENGYGITFNSQDGLVDADDNYINNEDIEVFGVQANYNLRKAIDFHGGLGIHVHDNFIKGFVYGGIYAVNEGAGEVGHFNYVKDVNIHDNHIENDATWFASLTFDGTSTPYSYPIQVGSFGDVEGTYGGGDAGTVKVIHNTIKNCSVAKTGVDYLYAPILVFGGAMQSLEIEDNTCEQATCEYAIYNSSNDYGQPETVSIKNNKLIEITAANELIICNLGANISVEDNKIINCTATYGIRLFEYGSLADFANVFCNNNLVYGTFSVDGIGINAGDMVACSNNKFAGTFTSGKCFNIASDLRFTAKNNIYLVSITPTAGGSIDLPDYISKSQGVAKYALETSVSSPITLDTLTLNVDSTAHGGYTGGSCLLDVKIMAARADQANYAIFTAQAIAGNISDTPYTNYTKVNGKEIVGNLPANIPTLSWVTDGYLRTLRLSLPNSYNSYLIEITFSAWRLLPYQKVA